MKIADLEVLRDILSEKAASVAAESDMYTSGVVSSVEALYVLRKKIEKKIARKLEVRNEA